MAFQISDFKPIPLFVLNPLKGGYEYVSEKKNAWFIDYYFIYKEACIKLW